MSLPGNNDEHKIATVDNSETKGDNERPNRCKASTSHATDGNAHDTHTGTVPKPSRCFHSPEASSSKCKSDHLAAAMEALKLSPSSSDDVLRDDWVGAKDSLERLNAKDKSPDIISSKSMSCTSSIDKSLIADSPHSESLIGNSKTSCSSSVSKVLAWDPWDKLGRKNKKENKRRKAEKTTLEQNLSTSPAKEKDTNRKDFKSGDENRQQVSDVAQAQEAAAENFEEFVYQPYQKNIRSVEFTNKVMVVYINKEDKVVGEASEPLKKELEQQIRNKEMRRGHMPDVTFARRNSMSEWFKK